MEDACLGYLGASTVISWPLDSKTFPWLAIPTTQPCHSFNNSRKREWGGMGIKKMKAK